MLLQKILKFTVFFTLGIHLSLAYGDQDFLDVGQIQRFDLPWIKSARNEEQALMLLLNTLTISKVGKDILVKAKNKAWQQGMTIFDLIKIGDRSFTDTTLVRKFSADGPMQVNYETRFKIYIDRNLSAKDALLDLAHELTHYNDRPVFNPYQSSFMAADFVKDTIEGAGGEVAAYLSECYVARDIFKSQAGQDEHCALILNHEGELSKEKAIAEFYKVGEHYNDFHFDLNNLGPHSKVKREYLSEKVSRDETIFISSAYGVPYPLAALLEYKTVMSKVCENDFKRLKLMKEKGLSDFDALFNSHQQRCDKFTKIF